MRLAWLLVDEVKEAMEVKRRCARSQGESYGRDAIIIIIKSSSRPRDQTSHLHKAGIQPQIQSLGGSNGTRTSRSVGSCSIFVLFRVKVDGSSQSRRRFPQSAGLTWLIGIFKNGAQGKPATATRLCRRIHCSIIESAVIKSPS